MKQGGRIIFRVTQCEKDLPGHWWLEDEMGQNKRKGPRAKECGQSLEAGQGKEQTLPRASGRKAALPTPRFQLSETHFGFLMSRTVR